MSTALERNALRMAREHKEKQTSLKPGFYVVDGRLSFDPFRVAPADVPRYDPRFERGYMTDDDWAEVCKRVARRAAEELSNGVAKQLAEHHKAAQRALANGVAVTRVMMGALASQNQKCGSDRVAEALTQYYQDRAKKPPQAARVPHKFIVGQRVRSIVTGARGKVVHCTYSYSNPSYTLRSAENLFFVVCEEYLVPDFVGPFTATHGKWSWSKDGVWSATDSQGGTTVLSTGGSITIDAGAQHGKV